MMDKIKRQIFKLLILGLDMKKGSKMTLEQKKRMIEVQKKVWSNPELRKRHSEIHKGQIPWCAGKKLSIEHKLNLSLSHKGKATWNKGLKGVQVSGMKGKHHIEESNIKNRLAHLGKPAWNKGKHTYLVPWNKGKKGTLHHTEEAKLKIKNSRAKQVFPIKDSLPEIKIQNFLKQLGITFLAHKHIKDIEHGYQCDILIPSMNLIIECDGDYWHGNQNIERFKDLNEYQKKKIILDNIRTKELIEKGFKVLRLWESDINKMDLKDFMERIKSF